MDKFKFGGSGTSGSAKMPDGKTHSIPEDNKMVGSTANASVGCSASVKYNINTKDPKTGNFIGVSLQVSAWCTMPCTPETADITYKNCEDFVGAKLLQSRLEYINRFQLKDWFGA